MEKRRARRLLEAVLNLPFLAWVLVGFSLSYLFFFVQPVFLSTDTMNFIEYVPALKPIGLDLKQMLGYSEALFVKGQSPYIGFNLYPPLASVLFAPLLSLKFQAAYRVVTFISLFCYAAMTLALPALRARRISPLILLFFISGLFSYGFQFELERGQFNVIAVFLCLLSVWMFHSRNALSFWVYLPFIAAVQLKIYPLIFVVMFIKDWRDWKGNLKRLAGLTAINLALFLALGTRVFTDFIAAVNKQTTDLDVWQGNHSIFSFTEYVSRKAGEQGLDWGSLFSSPMKFTLLALTLVCIAAVVVQAYRRNEGGLNANLLLACVVGALLIPSVSHDYKLSILAAPAVLALLDSERFFSQRHLKPARRFVFIALTLVFALAYSSTLFSYLNKPYYLDNNLPALLTMLLIAVYFSRVSPGSENPDNPQA
jgi:hypothetical protein